MLRTTSGKVHLADVAGLPRCGVRPNAFDQLEGDPGDVTCSRCGKLAADEAGVPTPPAVTPASSTTTPSITRGWQQRSDEVDAGAELDQDAGPLSGLRRLIAPLTFATVGGVGVIWMLRRRRRRNR